MSDDEILTGVSFPAGTEKSGSSFIKVGRVVLDLATVNAAVCLKRNGGLISEIYVAIGAVAPIPLRLKRVEDYLRGKTPGFEVFEAAGDIACDSVSPITDVRSTAEYRKAVSKTIIMDTLDRASRNAGGQ
jgi:carbon-monoxide dehydrogenase medium subunit